MWIDLPVGIGGPRGFKPKFEHHKETSRKNRNRDLTTTVGFNKYACFNRAKQLLEQNDDSVLRYVCLELRFCLETITYAKLKTYKKRIPPSLLEIWQPPQAFKALLQMEPEADMDFVFSISPESSLGVPTEDWKQLGTHKTFKHRWLRKTYNKLGSYLHIPTIKDQSLHNYERDRSLREYLSNTLEELEPIIQSNIDVSMANVDWFECAKCEAPIGINQKALENGKEVECLRPGCFARYRINKDGERDYSLRIQETVFPCGFCSEGVHIENRLIEIGFKFSCPKCQHAHQIKEWAYCLIDGTAPDNLKLLN